MKKIESTRAYAINILQDCKLLRLSLPSKSNISEQGKDHIPSVESHKGFHSVVSSLARKY